MLSLSNKLAIMYALSLTVREFGLETTLQAGAAGCLDKIIEHNPEHPAAINIAENREEALAHTQILIDTISPPRESLTQ